MGDGIELQHLTTDELLAGMDHLLGSPRDGGPVEMLVRRPGPFEREELDEAELDVMVGMVGDTWLSRGSRHTPDGSPKPGEQLTFMNSRVAALVATTRERWSLAGDQIYVDLDLGEANLPVGTHLQVGTAMVEVSADPHTGCKKFVERFGRDAMRFVNSEQGRALRLRGMNTRVIEPGTVRVGDVIRKA